MEYLHVLTSVNMENYPADMSPNFYKALNYDVTSVIMSIKWYRQKDKDCYQKRNRKKEVKNTSTRRNCRGKNILLSCFKNLMFGLQYLPLNILPTQLLR